VNLVGVFMDCVGTGADLDILVVGPAFFEAFVPVGVTPVPGAELFVESIGLGLGGALNSATVAAALGSRTGFMYPATSWIVDQAVTACNAMTGLVGMPWGAGGQPFVTLVWSNEVDRAFVSSCDWQPFKACPDFPHIGWIHVGGIHEYFLLERQIVAARAGGSRISTCAGWDPPGLDRLKDETRCLLDVLFMNRDEAEYLCGSVDAALSYLPGRVAVDVIVTDGARGACGSIGGQIVRADAPLLPAGGVVDPTGAGDAFAAAYLDSVVRSAAAGSFDATAALSRACQVASRVVGIKGGVVVDRTLFTGIV
jgi:ribokinase